MPVEMTLNTFDSLCPLVKARWASRDQGGRYLLSYPTPDPVGFSQAQAAMAQVCSRCRFVYIDEMGMSIIPKGKCSPSLAENNPDGSPNIEFHIGRYGP